MDTDETREAAACERYVSNGQHYVAWAGRGLSARFGDDNESQNLTPPSLSLRLPDTHGSATSGHFAV